MMRYTVLLSLLCACSSLSLEQRDQLALHQRNAKLYWEGNRLNQALVQIERGLELDPDDYTLATMQGAILLKQSPSSQGTDHRLLDQATEVLSRVFDVRSARRHEPALLFHYALARQRQGRRHAGEATRLQAMAERAPDSVDATKIPENRELAATNFTAATELFAVLIERGELLRLSHYHLLLGARDVNDHEAIGAHSTAYLTQTAKEQAVANAEIRRTNQPGYEQEQKVLLARLKREELEVRSLLAEYHYKRKNYGDTLTMLNRVLEVDPARSTDYYNRGRVLLHLNRDGDARADFRKFLATTDLPATSEKAVFAAAEISK